MNDDALKILENNYVLISLKDIAVINRWCIFNVETIVPSPLLRKLNISSFIAGRRHSDHTHSKIFT